MIPFSLTHQLPLQQWIYEILAAATSCPAFQCRLTGSDLTLIPEQSITELNIELDLTIGYELTGFDGHMSMAKSVQLDLVFLGRTFKGRFVVIDSEIGILGRNVLNHFSLVLDGPGLSWDQSDSPK